MNYNRAACASLTTEELAALALYGARATWPANFRIFQKGDPADGITVITRGSVVLRVQIRSGRGFVPVIVGVGETFGGEGIAGGQSYVTDAVTISDTESIHLARSQFRAFVRERPTQALGVIAQMMRERAQLLERVNQLASESVEQRLMAAIEKLYECRANGNANGKLELKPEQQRLLGEMVGATRESVSLALGRLAGSGLAEKRGVSFVVAASTLAKGSPQAAL